MALVKYVCIMGNTSVSIVIKSQNYRRGNGIVHIVLKVCVE